VTRDAWIFGVSGTVFGVLVGWILGSQRVAPPIAQPAAQTAQAPSGGAEPAPTLDTERAIDLERQANNRPTDAAVRIDLANLYYDARRFDLAVPWYEAALKLEPKNVNVSTDLALCFYATNEADRALKQIEYSLSVDPKHVKTLLNQGIILAFGKNDLNAAAVSWQKVIAIAPTSDEARIAKEGLAGIESRHNNTTDNPKGKGGGAGAK
jgi:cytochrome c-type biogenesis protein CcmH/NrfG